MISFESDYIAGAHPKILQRFIETNMEQVVSYGGDKYSCSAAEKIRKKCGLPEAEVYFLTGGTQTNQIVIDTMLQPYQGVIAADTGHIHGHEAGAVELAGHKVLAIPGKNGKLDAGDILNWVETFYGDDNHEHMVFPGMVYVSYPTEYGTIYQKEELEAIAAVCKQYDMTLFVDGARLGYGLASKQADMTMAELAAICDVFYIGGTKVGALCGEAVVFTKQNSPKHFMTQIKQHGALLAKGRLLGVQFDTLFTDDLYEKISLYAIEMAEQLKEILREKQYAFYLDSPTNQQFVIMENTKMEELKQKVRFGFWEKYDANHTVVRFATSWSTTEQDLETLKTYL